MKEKNKINHEDILKKLDSFGVIFSSILKLDKKYSYITKLPISMLKEKEKGQIPCFKGVVLLVGVFNSMDATR